MAHLHYSFPHSPQFISFELIVGHFLKNKLNFDLTDEQFHMYKICKPFSGRLSRNLWRAQTFEFAKCDDGKPLLTAEIIRFACVAALSLYIAFQHTFSLTDLSYFILFFLLKQKDIPY